MKYIVFIDLRYQLRVPLFSQIVFEIILSHGNGVFGSIVCNEVFMSLQEAVPQTTCSLVGSRLVTLATRSSRHILIQVLLQRQHRSDW